MQYKKLTLATASLGFITGVTLGLGACRFSEPDPNHCARQDGNAACEEKFGDERPYCTMCGDPAFYNDGCAEEEPTDLNCYSPCGDMQNYNENSSCLEVGDGDGDGDGDGEGDGDGDGDGDPMLCMGPEDCSDPTTPFCDINSGECVACDAIPNGDMECSDLSGGATPVCADGICVQCDAGKDEACEGMTPVCDDATNTCVGCSSHEQCPDSACNLAAGNCIDPASVVHVNGSSDASCAPNGGTEAMPYCTLGQALLGVDTDALIILHEFATPPFVYPDDSNTVQVTVAIFAPPGESPVLRGTVATPALTVAAAGTLFMRGVTISDTANGGEGLVVAGGGAWVESSRIVNNTGGGIVVDGGGTLALTNSFVGGDQNDQFAVHVLDGSATLTYVTLAAGFGTAAALGCDDGSGTVVRNSLLIARTNTPELMCTGVTITDSALEMAVAGNTSLGMMTDTSWFTNYAQGDFHLTGTHPAIESAATWMTGDPAVDIDGEARPNTDGSADVAGADVP